MLWWVGIAFVVVWLILFLFHPAGWIPLLLLGGITMLVVQTAAYRKTKAATKNHG